MKVLQYFGFQESSYERPNQNWVCGHRDAGNPCPLGPDGRGVCQATFECQPHKSETEERWECTRPATRGGSCEQGPLPDGTCCKALAKCNPQLSLRAKRGRAVRWAMALAVGFIVFLVAFNGDQRFLSPGPLSSVHSSLNSCQNCHANVAAGDFNWMQSIFVSADAPKDSAACSDCHKSGNEALKPHGLAESKLQAITKRHQAVSPISPEPILTNFRNAMFPVEEAVKNGVTCATCHKEHQGKKNDLKAMPDTQCQTCHVKQFNSFQDGHPEFTNFPFERRTRIIFDHAAHFAKYIPKTRTDGKVSGKLPETCANCHKIDGSKGLMVVKRYDTMCATCHAGQIAGAERASGPKGVTFLTLPGLDLTVLRERNADIGEWPEDAEAEISPMMKLLIGSDDKRREILDAVEKLDLLDLTDASDDDIAMVEKLVWEVKSLIYQFTAVKPRDAMKMLSPEMGGNINTGLLARLTANMPRDVMQGVQRDWLPNLPAEVLRRLQGQRLEPIEPVAADGTVAETAKTDGSDTPSQDSADGAGDDILAEDKGDDILSGGDDILAEDKGDDILPGSEDILAEDKGDDILSGSEDILAEDKGGDILAGNDDILADTNEGDILSGDTGAEEVTKAAESKSKPELPEPLDAEAWAETGGWYRQDFAVLYKPVGHRDDFMQAWLDYSGTQYGKDTARLAAPVFDMLSDKQAQGQCAKCHSVDGAGEESRRVNWKPFKVLRSSKKFTKFSHEPHFGQFKNKGCLACHVVDSDAKYTDTYKSLDPKVFVSNFKPVKQQQCSACHQPKIAGQSCVLCHVYHMDNVITPILTTRIPDK